MQYTTKRISWKTWFKLERNWKLFANSDFLKSYTPGWLRRVIHIRLTVIYKLNGFSFTWLKRKSYWKTLSWVSRLFLCTVEGDCSAAYTLRGLSISIAYTVLKGTKSQTSLQVYSTCHESKMRLPKIVVIVSRSCVQQQWIPDFFNIDRVSLLIVWNVCSWAILSNAAVK